MRCGGSGSGCGTCEILGILTGVREKDGDGVVDIAVDGAVGWDSDMWKDG